MRENDGTRFHCIYRSVMEVTALRKSGPESAVQNIGFIYGLFNGTQIL
jgi:hypothetical protein